MVYRIKVYRNHLLFCIIYVDTEADAWDKTEELRKEYGENVSFEVTEVDLWRE